MSLSRKVAYNTIIQVVGKVVTTAISLVLVASLTRYLGVAGYGQYTTIFAYIALFGVLADFGFFWILIREMANPDADTNKATSNILTMRTILATAVYAIAFLVGFVVPQYEGFKWGIGIIALASLFLTLNQTYVGVFQNKLRMDKAALTDAVSRAIILVITLSLIKFNLGLNAILWAYTAGNLINLVLSAYLGREYVKLKPAFDFSYWKEVFWQAFPMGVVLILNLVYFRVDTLMLSLMKGDTDVGIYGPPYKVLEILLFFPSIFMGNVFPIVTKYLYEKNERVNAVMQKSFDFLVIVSLPIILGIIFTSEQIIRIVAGREFLTAATVDPIFGIQATSTLALQILVVAVGVSFLSHLFGYFNVALGKQAKLIIPNLILVIFNIGLNIFLIPKYSYIGAAFSTVLTEALVLWFSWWIARKYFNLKITLGIIWKVAIAGVVLVFFLYAWHNWNLFILIPISFVIYTATLWVVGGVNKQMILSLIKRQDNENSN